MSSEANDQGDVVELHPDPLEQHLTEAAQRVRTGAVSPRQDWAADLRSRMERRRRAGRRIAGAAAVVLLGVGAMAAAGQGRDDGAMNLDTADDSATSLPPTTVVAPSISTFEPEDTTTTVVTQPSTADLDPEIGPTSGGGRGGAQPNTGASGPTVPVASPSKGGTPSPSTEPVVVPPTSPVPSSTTTVVPVAVGSARFYLHDGQVPLDRGWIAIDFADHTTITVDTDASGWTPVVTGPAGTWRISTFWEGDPQPDPARPDWQCRPFRADLAVEQVPANASLQFRYLPSMTPEPSCGPAT